MRSSELLNSSSFRLAVGYMGLFAISVLLLLAFIYWSTISFMASQTDATIRAEITGLAEQYREGGLEDLVRTIRQRIERDPSSASVYLFATSNYQPLTGNISGWPDTKPDRDGWLTFEFTDARDPQRVLRARARQFRLQDGLLLLVGRDIRELDASRRLLINALTWGMGLTLLLALAGGLVMSRGVLRRIERINQASREIMAGDLKRRVETRGAGDEFDQLAVNLNAMLDEIERLMNGIRHVSDNIAHDLRTPLTRLRTRLEQLRSQLGDDDPAAAEAEQSIAEADQLLATFGALLRIARIEAGAARNNITTRVDLAQLVTDAAELYDALAEEKEIVIETRAQNPVIVTGDRDLLFQAVINLLDNAIKYSPAGGRVTLQLTAGDKATLLDVADHGPGIPHAQREQVVQRFYRLDNSRGTPGSGLGLSLVAAVASMHRARLELLDNRPGLRARLRFDRNY